MKWNDPGAEWSWNTWITSDHFLQWFSILSVQPAEWITCWISWVEMFQDAGCYSIWSQVFYLFIFTYLCIYLEQLRQYAFGIVWCNYITSRRSRALQAGGVEKQKTFRLRACWASATDSWWNPKAQWIHLHRDLCVLCAQDELCRLLPIALVTSVRVRNASVHRQIVNFNQMIYSALLTHTVKLYVLVKTSWWKDYSGMKNNYFVLFCIPLDRLAMLIKN